MSAILQNPETLSDAFESANDAAGSAIQENERYLDSIQGRIDLFTNAVQTMWSNAIDDDFVKMIVDIGTELIKLIDKIGLFPSILGGLFIYFTAFQKHNPVTVVKDIGEYFVNAGKNAQQYGVALNALNAQQQAQIMASKGASQQAIVDQLVTKGNVDAKTAEVIATKALTEAKKEQTAVTGLDLMVATADQKLTLSDTALTWLAAHAEENLTKELLEQALAQGILTKEEYASITAKYASLGATNALSLGVKGLSATIKTAMASNPIGWIMMAVSAVMMLAYWISSLKSKTEKLTEELSGLKSELRDIKSDIESLNSELETTQDRMAELLAMDTLSFTEKEELKNLQKTNDELQRELDLLALKEKQKTKETAKKFAETMEEDVHNRDEYATYGKRTWAMRFVETLFGDGQGALKMSEDEYIEQKLQRYEELAKEKKNVEEDILKEGSTDTKNYKKLSKRKDEIDTEIGEIESYINKKTSKWDENIGDLEYYTGDNLEDWQKESNEWLDYVNNMQDKWAIISSGENAKSNAITRIFNKKEFTEASDEIDNLVEKLKQDPTNQTIIDKISQKCKLAEEDLLAVGLSAQEATDYFTQFASASNFNTLDGKIDEISRASQTFEDLLKGNEFKVDGAEIGLAELFDEEGKIAQDKLSQIFNNTSEQTRDDITSILEGSYSEIKDKTFDIETLLTKFASRGSQQIIDLQKTMLTTTNQELFPNLKDDISGIIDTFDELAKAVGDVVDSMDLLEQARAEEAYSGSVSLETLQNLMAYTDDYAKLVEVDETGAIHLAANAQEILIQEKLNAIKANAQLAYEEANKAYQEALAAETSVSASKTIKNMLLPVIDQVSGGLAFLGSLWSDVGEAWADGFGGTTFDLGASIDKAQGAYNKTITSRQDNRQEESATTLANAEEALKRATDNLKIANNLTADNVKTRYSSDEASGGSSTKKDAENSKADDIQEKYERQISNLDNQQTYLQNEIDRLEAENKGVSKSYYEEQIDLEEKKLSLYQQERAELLKLERTDEVAEKLWEVEHAIQESTMRMVEFRQSIVDLYKTAFDDVITAYDNKDDSLSDRQNYIEKYNELTELQGGVATASSYQAQIGLERSKKANNLKELNDLVALRDKAVASGYLKEGSEEWIEMEDKIRATEEAILDNDVAIAQYNESLKQLSVEAFDSVRNAFSNKDNFLTSQQDYIEGYADLLEAQGIDVPAELYDTLISIEEEKRANNVADLVDARQGLADIEAAGYTAADEEWQDAYNRVVELEKAVQDNDIAMANYEKTIRDLDFEKFERFIGRLDDVNSEIEHIRNLLADEDVAFEDGTWTEEGMTSLGLAYQQMELAKQKSQEYAEKIDELTTAYDNGEMSEKEYYDRLQELKEGQWGAIESYEDAKDAIVDMEEARIDMIEEGINEEIEAYQELIDLKKEELDAERDLYEFKKNVEKQTKDIASLERRIASLSGSTDASDIAERRKLEAELRDAQEGLDDTYYGHAKDQQSKALDDELEAYQDAQDKYLEMLRDALEDTEAIVNEKITELLTNADVALNGLNAVSNEHGITLSTSLTQPWQNASDVAIAFKTSVEENLPLLTNEDGVITLFSTDAKAKLEGVFTTGGTAATSFRTSVNEVIGNIKTVVANSTSSLTANLKLPWNDLTSNDSPINTFSKTAKGAITDAITTAKNNAVTMKDSLSSPWEEGTKSANTFSEKTQGILNKAVRDANKAAREIEKALNIKYPSYEGNGSGDNGNDSRYQGNNNYDNNGDNKQPSSAVRNLQKILIGVYQKGITVDGLWGSRTAAALKEVQGTIKIAKSGKYDNNTARALESDIKNRIKLSDKEGQHVYADKLRGFLDIVPVAFHAKGTMGTTRDEWAITDEPQWGDELVLVPNAMGNLSFMRKGTSVVPADITENLVKWGQMNPDMAGMSESVHGVNLMSNFVNKPELNLSFDALLKAEHITEETLPAVKKLVTEELDNFARKLNYSLRKVGAT